MLTSHPKEDTLNININDLLLIVGVINAVLTKASSFQWGAFFMKHGHKDIEVNRRVCYRYRAI